MYNFLIQTKFCLLKQLKPILQPKYFTQSKSTDIIRRQPQKQRKKVQVVFRALILTKHQKHPPQPVLSIKVTREISGKLRTQKE